ncbi:MAG TPA: hypothetical protein DCE13_07310 [Cryomorphaceae bacterium]|jgi:hypothetical protein|nr:MAG: hypothetical protein ABR98_02720 [Cryomorphaceae bacterium BACL7 MAG-120910-bin2]KRO84133.1 MAG: hypothetical protein ABR87_06220 [Cryomorphaceae bacterium BACL7 MAG-121220-bin83]HAB32336.1 hypothetical protein [Cryomorphaceae bacterium]
MKKLTLVAAAAALSLTAFGQNVERTAPNVRMNADAPVRHLNPAQLAAFYGAETPVWSQDFANGIPTTWLNYGTAAGSSDPDAKWEYRGTSTTPSNTVGSRGAYMSAQTPIASATASNGFVVFDSDFLDNAGVAGNFGNGIAAAPHLAELTTDMIDLSNYSVVDLLFTQYYRRFAGAGGSQAVPATYIDFSTDGGTTFPYSVTLNSGVAVNSSTATNDVVVVQAGAYVGGQDSVKVRFRFDGDYYFWCVDDISIVNTPPNRMAFTDWQGAPAQDIIYGPSASGSSKMGIMTAKQSRGVTFDCNAINSGTNTQTNVKLQMKIYNGGSLVQTVNSSTVSSLAAGDTANYNDLNTYSTAWTPTANGSYEVVYGLLSDSVSVYSDTTMLYVNDSLMSMDFNSWDNSIGASTNATQWGDGAQMCNRHDLVDDEMLFGAKVYLSSLTMSGAILELAVYDSSAFLGNSGGWDANKLVAYGQQVISAADTALGFVRFDFTDPTTGRGVDLEVAKGAYFYNLTMYDNQAANYLAIRNDQTWAKTAGSGYMYLAALGSWYSGYSNSKSFNNLWIRGIHCPASSAAACMGIGMDEQAMEQIVMSPNPASEFVNLNFGLAMGDYHVAIVDFTGKVMKNEVVRADANVSIFIGDLTSGMYMVRVQKGDDVKTMKLSVL